MEATQFSPGSLIRARGREWMVINSVGPETLRVRPLSGSEEEQTLIYLPLEKEPVTTATFPKPQYDQRSGHDGAMLLRDALILSLRRGAGPFRSLGHISIEPRAYQLVPLLMALKQDVVRLLIADDVGVGKTIEAGLIAREMLDRGEIERLAVLCPPHLVDQWLSELEDRFHLNATPVTSSSAARLERGLPPGTSIFSAHPFTVVSLDYIKSDRRRSEFLRACPEFVIVDEAHTCSSSTRGKHRRYELLRDLSENTDRHMVFLTATPHSGDDAGFYRLLGLIDKKFGTIPELDGAQRKKVRDDLRNYFVQRRRPDIEEWKDNSLFPKRETAEIVYSLSGKWIEFFEKVREYCTEVVDASGSDEKRKRLNFWGTLALLRCVASSPAAAAKSLRTRAFNSQNEIDETDIENIVFDGDQDILIEDDVELGVGNEDPRLKELIEIADKLVGQKDDPKLKILVDHVDKLLEEGFNPVIFCRFIATANYLGEKLKVKFKNTDVQVITGELSSSERKDLIDKMRDRDSKQRLLVATDCLSEGINLQETFDSVVHYDLSWNPTRHEQREGRVDRFGQQQPVVRTTLMYGDHPVDGAVLEVILRKAESIRRELGVPVPLPDEGHKLTQALMKSVLIRGKNLSSQKAEDQLSFEGLEVSDEAKAIDEMWENAAKRAKENRTIFAQRSLKPEQVLPEWEKAVVAIGGTTEVERFTTRALMRLGAPLEKKRKGFLAPIKRLPDELKMKFEDEGIVDDQLIDFKYPSAPKCKTVMRSSPIVHVLAENLLEKTLAVSTSESGTPESNPEILGRCGCWLSSEVESITTLVVLRLRHQLIVQRSKDVSSISSLLVEEGTAISWSGKNLTSLNEAGDAFNLFNAAPEGDPPQSVKDRAIKNALEELEKNSKSINNFADKRAKKLLEDHKRVRDASKDKGTYTVSALLPPDIIGVYVLMPRVGE